MSEAGRFSVTFDVPIQIEIDAANPDDALEMALEILSAGVGSSRDDVTLWEPRKRPTVERTEEADE